MVRTVPETFLSWAGLGIDFDRHRSAYLPIGHAHNADEHMYTSTPRTSLGAWEVKQSLNYCVE